MPEPSTHLQTLGSAVGYATRELKFDMHSKNFTAFAPLTPLTAILNKLSMDPAHNFRIDWHEQMEMPTLLKVAASEASAGTSVSFVAHGASLVVDTILFNPAKWDWRRVSAQPSANTVTVAKDILGNTSSAWEAGDPVHVLPPDLPENDESFRPASVQDEEVYNFIQLNKLHFKITRIGDKMETHFGGPGSKRMQLQRQKYREYRIKKEKHLIMGARSSSGTAPATRYSMGGLTYFLRNGTLYWDFNGWFTETGLQNMLGAYHEENPDATTLWYFVSTAVRQKIMQMGLGNYHVQLNAGETQRLGLRVDSYLNGPVTTNLVEMPLLTDSATRGWGMVLDMERLRLKTLDPDALHLDAKTIGESEIIYDCYRGVYSLLVANESRHMFHEGATL